MDAFAFVVDFQRFTVVALSVADVAVDVNIGQEVHLDLDRAVTLAGLAAPALDVEREAPRSVAAGTRFRHAGEQLADRRHQAGVSGRVGTRGAAYR